jgi:uncharacterized protein with ParB-like and HNH nuclease domain
MLIEKEIISVEEMLNNNLVIPDYQRPYKWKQKNILHLVNDIKESMEGGNGKNNYRIGTIILYKNEKNDEYNIVDGQQRLVSLTIVLYILGEKNPHLLEWEFSEISKKNIIENYKIIKEQLKKIDRQDEYKKYILEKCEFVKIVTDKEQEAFQFFDSQNSRGKPLKPHDLLRAYHLREMKEDKNKAAVIKGWEDINEDLLADLFKYYLYPIKRWIKLKDGLGKTPKKGNLNFDSNKIDIFKGIKADCPYNFAVYHRRNQENDSLKCKNVFQLDQHIIAGKPFFDFVLYYYKLLEEIKVFIKENRKKKTIPEVPNENLVKKIYESILLFYIDRFGDKQKEYARDYFFRWAYFLRVNLDSVYELSLNKYAKDTGIFQKISEAMEPDKIFSMNLNSTSEVEKPKYKELYKYLISNKEEYLQ